MSKPVQAQSLSGTELQTVLTALSLDCGRHFWTPTGLSVSDNDARAILSAARSALLTFEEGTDSPYEADYSPDRAHAIGRAFDTELSKSVSRKTIDQVMRWSGALLGSGERDWYQGLLACLALMNDPVRGYGTLVLNKADRDAALRLIVEVFRNPSDDELVRRSEEGQSDFDRKISLRSQSVGSAASSLKLLLLRIRYEHFIERVQGILSPQGARVFSAWLEDQIRTSNASADYQPR